VLFTIRNTIKIKAITYSTFATNFNVTSSAEQSLSEVAGGSVGDQKIEENEKAIAAEDAVTAARRVDEEIASSSSINEISRQIRKQASSQVEIEKTLSLLDNSVKQIKQDHCKFSLTMA
jgi:hypothetical protein